MMAVSGEWFRGYTRVADYVTRGKARVSLLNQPRVSKPQHHLHVTVLYDETDKKVISGKPVVACQLSTLFGRQL